MFSPSKSSMQKLKSSFGGSIASIKSLVSRNKIQPFDMETSDDVYKIKDFDNYKSEVQRSDNNKPIDLNSEKDNTCGQRILKIVRRAWATRYTEEVNSNKIVLLKTALRELMTYLIFLVVLMMVAFGTRSDSIYYLTISMSNLLVTQSFNQITGVDKFWDYMTGDFIQGTYWNNTWYNEGKIRKFIYYENMLVGIPQIRQLRIRSNTCPVSSHFQRYFLSCYGDYSTSNSNQTSYGDFNDTAWNFGSPSSLGGFSFSGIFANYEDGGFIKYLSRNVDDTTSILNNLKANLWVDRGTRVVFVDYTVYNANVNLYCIIKLIFEFPPTGGCIPTSQIRTAKLLRYESPFDLFLLGCEIVLIFFIIYYIIEEIIEIRRNRLLYFVKIWNLIDILMVFMSLVAIGLNVYRVMKINGMVNELITTEDKYPNFDFVAIWNKHFNDAVSITAFFGILKIFKYISFNKTMNLLTDTLGNSMRDIAGFAIMFFIVFFAFAEWGYLQFGAVIVDFCRFPDSVFTLFRLILGDFNFMPMVQANSLIGPIFFISYVFFVFFVLMNMFIAIINDSYEVVKQRIMESKDDLEITKFLQTHIFNRLKRNKIIKIQEVLENTNITNCEQLTFHDWRDELQRRGYAEVEIQALFLRYDSDGDRMLDYEERRLMLNDLKSGKLSDTDIKESDNDSSHISMIKENNEPDLVDEELFNDLVERVDSVEQCVYGIVTKINDILTRLSEMEKAKLDHQKSVSCSLSILLGTQTDFYS